MIKIPKPILAALTALVLSQGLYADQYQISVKEERLDELMGFLDRIASGWEPETFLDMRRDWPDSYVTRFGQPFNAWTFALNSAAIKTLSENEGEDETLVRRQAEYLSFVASQYTTEKNECLFVSNEFDYMYRGLQFNSGFRGSLLNNLTAYGYMELYRATQNKEYLDLAHWLLRTTAFCEDPDVTLHSRDDEGYLWLDKVVFKSRPKDDENASFQGMPADEHGWRRAKIYNGHISSIYAFIKYELITGSDEFEGVVDELIDTMERWLPNQIYKDQYFSYSLDFGIMPDYGQWRAVRLANGLCEITEEESLCSTADEMETLFHEVIEGNEEEILEKGNAEGMEIIRSL